MLKFPLLNAAIAICASTLFSDVTLASDPPTFGPFEAVSTITPAASMVTGDFDGDGVPDVAVMGGIVDSNGISAGGSVEIHFGDGSGGFRTATATISLNLPGSSYSGIAAADLNGVGKSQLIIAGTNIVVIYTWSSGVNFNQTHTIDLTPTGITGTYVAVGDLTKHGSRDIVVSDHYDFINGSIGLAWITNDGTGNFGMPVVVPAWGCVSPPVLADVNGDGLVDIVLDDPAPQYTFIGTNGLQQGGTVGVLLNNGNGTFGQEIFWGNTASTNSAGHTALLNTVGVAVADVDGDGKADLISGCFLNDNFPNYPYYLNVNLGNGDGTFQDGIAFPVTNGITALAAADINGDGRVDIVTIDNPFIDHSYCGFLVTELSGSGTSLAVARQTDFPTPFVDSEALTYKSLSLGYKSSNGKFVTFNNDPKIDVLLGSGQNIYGANQSISHQVALFKNTTGTILPPTTLVILGAPTAGNPMFFIASQPSTVTGLAVRIQYTTTTNIEASWTDLPDGHAGHLTPGGSGLYSFGTVGTTFYPAGTAVYFRAITSASGFTDSISAPSGPYKLEQGKFTINLRLTSTSDPSGKLQVSHLGDTLTYTFIWTNIGNATAHNVRVQTLVPTYIDATSDLTSQFPLATLTFAQYGSYTNETKPGAGDATITWSMSDLPPGYSQAVTLGVHIGAQVRTEQQLGLPNSDYQVYSASSEPPIAATGFSSGARNVDSTVLGPIKVTITPNVTKVAPGGVINYTIKVQNTASYTARNVVIADPVPEFASFVSAAFINPPPSPALKVIGKKVTNPLRLIGLYPPTSRLPEVQAFLASNPQIVAPSDNADQVVFYVGNLASGATATVRLSVQAQYLDPIDVTDGEIKNFDYLAYLEDPSGNIVESKNEAGLIFTPVVGPVINAPNLSMLKLVAPQDLSPGDTFVVGFAVKNNSITAANDVFIQDLLPAGGDGAVNPVLLTGTEVDAVKKTLVPGTNVLGSTYFQQTLNSVVAIAASGASQTLSANYFVTLDPSGTTITVHGLHLEPQALIGVGYAMKVPATTPVPESLVAGASFIGAGNGDRGTNGTTNQFIVTTPVGTPQETSLTVNGKIALFTPSHPFEAVPSPLISSNPTATAAQLDVLYKVNPNASLILPKSNPPEPVPGVQLYFLHYQNLGVNIANDAHLLFAMPANTAFYRASLVENGNLLKLGPGQSINEPSKLGSGDVIFNLGSVSNGSGGYAMVEVILLPNAITTSGSRIVASAPQFYTGAQPAAAPKKLDATADSDGTVVYDGQNVPHVGIVKIVPQAIQQGAVFAIQCAVFDYGNVDESQTADVKVNAPAGTEIVYLTGDATVVSSNSTSMDLSLGFGNHYASGFNVEFRVTGAVTNLAENAIFVTVPYVGTFSPPPSSIKVVGAEDAIPDNTITTVLGAQFVTMGEMTVIPLGPYQSGVGSALVCGPTGDFGDLHQATTLSDAWGTTMVVGPAQDINMLKLPVLGNTDAKSALQNIVSIVGKHGGNIFNTPQDNLIAPDGESFIDNNTGAIAKTGATLATVKALLKAGAQSVVASGASILPALANAGPAVVSGGTASVTGGGHVVTFGGGVISNDGASVVSNDGGSLIGQDGGGLISQDGGGLLTQDGGGLVSNASGTLISSVASGGIVASGAGNIVASGAGNIVASGAGN